MTDQHDMSILIMKTQAHAEAAVATVFEDIIKTEKISNPSVAEQLALAMIAAGQRYLLTSGRDIRISAEMYDRIFAPLNEAYGHDHA